MSNITFKDYIVARIWAGVAMLAIIALFSLPRPAGIAIAGFLAIIAAAMATGPFLITAFGNFLNWCAEKRAKKAQAVLSDHHGVPTAVFESVSKTGGVLNLELVEQLLAMAQLGQTNTPKETALRLQGIVAMGTLIGLDPKFISEIQDQINTAQNSAENAKQQLSRLAGIYSERIAQLQQEQLQRERALGSEVALAEFRLGKYQTLLGTTQGTLQEIISKAATTTAGNA